MEKKYFGECIKGIENEMKEYIREVFAEKKICVVLASDDYDGVYFTPDGGEMTKAQAIYCEKDGAISFVVGDFHNGMGELAVNGVIPAEKEDEIDWTRNDAMNYYVDDEVCDTVEALGETINFINARLLNNVNGGKH